MSNAKNIVLRVQTPEGTKRIDVCPGDSIKSVYDKVFNAFSLRTYNFTLYKNRNNKDEVVSSKKTTVASKDLKHGDVLYLQSHDGSSLFPQQQSTSGSSTSQSTPSGDPGFDPQEGMSSSNLGPPVKSSNMASSGLSSNFVEDEVDKTLGAMDGKILRQRDQKLCHHNANGCCIHCSPLEPYDEAYLREHNVKHLSFHSYLRKLTGGVDRGKFVALENTSCRIKPGCKDHPPWPKGICSKCQPSAITLNRQAYRHVDNVMFENPEIVERFLEYWRNSGHQRMGYLYGNMKCMEMYRLGFAQLWLSSMSLLRKQPETKSSSSPTRMKIWLMS
uniref:Nuclear protein localization protein 4 n=1 Tax=Lygus hesperus TaxID=30085 RepID=A0A0A9WVS7_LYGHE